MDERYAINPKEMLDNAIYACKWRKFKLTILILYSSNQFPICFDFRFPNRFMRCDCKPFQGKTPLHYGSGYHGKSICLSSRRVGLLAIAFAVHRIENHKPSRLFGCNTGHLPEFF